MSSNATSTRFEGIKIADHDVYQHLSDKLRENPGKTGERNPAEVWRALKDSYVLELRLSSIAPDGKKLREGVYRVTPEELKEEFHYWRHDPEAFQQIPGLLEYLSNSGYRN